MRRSVKRTIGQRIAAAIVSILLVISILPLPVFSVYGETAQDDNPENIDNPIMPLGNEEASDFESVIITPLDADYNGSEQNLVSVSVETEDATVEYSTDNSSWSLVVPTATEADEYPVYVRISKEGYNPYLSGKQTAKIKKIDITGIDIAAKQLNYVEGTEQELVILSGTLEETDSVTWYVNETETGSREIPKKLAVGNYSVKLVVNRGNNYNEFSKTVNCEIKNAPLDLNDLEVVALDSVYTGSAQPTVSVRNQGDYTLKYQLDEGDTVVNANAWQDEIPTAIDAGSYIVWVKAVKENYEDSNVNVVPAENAVAPYNVYVAKASQNLTFSNPEYNTENSQIMLTKEELQQGQVFDFGAVDSDALAGGSISYSIELDTSDTGIASINSGTGLLTVTGVGAITVKATLSGNENYAECTISHTLNVSAEQTSVSEYIGFPYELVEYKVGNIAGISANVATRKEPRDYGEITYEIENGNEKGLVIGNDGIISITDYEKLISAVESNDGTLDVTVTVFKNVWKSWTGHVKYPADSASYILRVTVGDIPENPYKLLKEDGTDIEGPDGNEGWFKSVITVEPATGYKIIKSDDMASGTPVFSDSVKYGATVDGIAQDQGESSLRAIYLQNISTGEITKKVNISDSVKKIDTVKPYDLSIVFPDTEEEDNIKYYDGAVNIKLIAYDNTSGVKSFDWEYTKTVDAGDEILSTDTGTVEAVLDPTDSTRTRYIGNITLPKSELQPLKGTLKFSATDKAGNMSDEFADDGVFVIDTSIPGIELQTAGFNTVEGIRYYSGDAELTFKVTRLRFFPSRVEVSVSKNDEAPVVQNLTWSDTTNASEHEAKLYLREEAKYIVTLKYLNSSGSALATYTSEPIVIDKTSPSIKVDYSAPDNTFEGKEYYKNTLTATFSITEKNFFEKDVKVWLKKDNGSAVQITPTWADSADNVHVGTYKMDASQNHANDGHYTFTVEYKDRSNNAMSTYTSETKVMDTTLPVIQVDYSNANPDTTIVDSEGNERKYFSTTNTATITITERNFDPKDATYTITAKDVAGNLMNAEALYSQSGWTTSGDNNILTITYPGDANYSFDIECTDLAKQKAVDYDTDYFTVDTTGPTDLKITYSASILDTMLSAVTFGFYNAKATVTISATDNISGIYSMKYSYIKADGVSGVNAQIVDEIIDATQITRTNGDAVGTATFEITKGSLGTDNQFNGTVNFTATDRANNESDYLKDSKRIVVDNISPTATVEYNVPVQNVNGISYYDGNINATVTIQEANFYQEDVNISATKDGVTTPVTVNWSDNSTDVHIGTFTLSEDGDYFVNITYSDKSNNAMPEYVSEQMVIDTEIEEAIITINGQDADGKAFKDEVVPAVSFEDKNFESCNVKLFRTRYAQKDVDVTDQFITGHITINDAGGRGTFDTFEKTAENDGIYTLVAEMKDKAGHTIEKSITFTVNRYGSVYEYSDYLVSLIENGGAYVQSVDDSIVITEYNADRLVSGSLNIEISKDGKPLESSKFTVTPEINENVETGSSGWYQYTYTIDKDNFASDGVYKVAISSKDETGNTPENTNYENMGILFRVDSTAPEITSITGLENKVVNATEQTIKYTVYDTIGLQSVTVFVNGKEVDSLTDFSEDANNYSGVFTIGESSSAQNVRLVVTDLAGNITDTSSKDFTSSYAFSDSVTVSTNVFVRWYANKALFFGSIGGGAAALGGGAGATVFFRRRKILKFKK